MAEYEVWLVDKTEGVYKTFEAAGNSEALEEFNNVCREWDSDLRYYNESVEIERIDDYSEQKYREDELPYLRLYDDNDHVVAVYPCGTRNDTIYRGINWV